MAQTATITPHDPVVRAELMTKAARAKRLPMNNEWLRLHREMNALLDQILPTCRGDQASTDALEDPRQDGKS